MLESLVRQLRLDILDTVYHAGFGHIGGSLSSIDIFIPLYFSHLFDFDRDHFTLSAGHLCLSLYTVLAKKGKIQKELLSTYAQLGSPLQGHVSTDVPGVEYSSGSLGQGLSFAAGLALGDRENYSVCLTTDGEHDEGQTWEAIMFASKFRLGNLINIVDVNGQQIGGSTNDIMPIKDLTSKYSQFGWRIFTVDGHNLDRLVKVLNKAKQKSAFPVCIIARTVMGKGISFMEGDYHYHDVKDLSQELYLRAKNELQNS